jgi:hypothetical protein
VSCVRRAAPLLVWGIAAKLSVAILKVDTTDDFDFTQGRCKDEPCNLALVARMAQLTVLPAREGVTTLTREDGTGQLVAASNKPTAAIDTRDVGEHTSGNGLIASRVRAPRGCRPCCSPWRWATTTAAAATSTSLLVWSKA